VEKVVRCKAKKTMRKKIQHISPLLADHFVDTEIDTMTIERNKKLVTDNADRLGQYYKYLGLLHDSWLIKTNITANRFSIILNDFTTHVFSDVIVERKKIKIDHEKLVFPIHIDFDIINLTFNTVDEFGNIQIIESTTIDEYLYEQIISIDKDIMEIGLVVWKNGINDKPG
jgi:hypothetical protein